MTAKREKAFRNAIASTRMEGLSFSKKSEQDCLRYLDGHLDAATLVREVLRQRLGVVGEIARRLAVEFCGSHRTLRPRGNAYALHDRPIFCRLLSLHFRPYQ